MSKAAPFPDEFFDAPETDPLNKSDWLTPDDDEAPVASGRATDAARQRERGLDSVFAASAPLEGVDLGNGAGSQRAILITRTTHATDGLDELNEALCSGWRLVHVTLMGDSGQNARWLPEDEAGAYFSALVFVEHAGPSGDGPSGDGRGSGA